MYASKAASGMIFFDVYYAILLKTATTVTVAQCLGLVAWQVRLQAKRLLEAPFLSELTT
jgi:hypothetical protein